MFAQDLTLQNLLVHQPDWVFGMGNKQDKLKYINNLLSLEAPEQIQINFASIATSLLKLAWEENPLDPEIISYLQLLINIGLDLKTLFTNNSQTVEAILKHYKQPNIKSNIIFENDIEDTKLFFIKKAKKEPKNLFWLQQALFQSIYNNNFELLQEIISIYFSNSTLNKELSERLELEWSLHCLSSNENEKKIINFNTQLFINWKDFSRADLAIKNNNFELAKQLSITLWKKYPWHPNLILILYDFLKPIPETSKPYPLPPILLYTWNKEKILYNTLTSLRNSNIDNASVFVLNNGSTDNTRELLKSFQDSWGMSFEIITLPTNIGAPPARNWLLSLEKVKKYDEVVFLDDDVLLEKNWLQKLYSLTKQFPNYGTIGCIATNHTQPYAIQAAEFNLCRPDFKEQNFEDLQTHIIPFCSAMGQKKIFPFYYTRQSISVTGCCHIVSKKAINKAGAFDPCFNPSQFDDFERDLRSSLLGYPTYYCGQVQIKHVQHSSLKQATDNLKIAQVMGNKLKLEFLYNEQQIKKLINDHLKQLNEDLMKKYTVIKALLK